MLIKIVILSLTILTSDGRFSTDLYVMPSFEKCIEVAHVVSDLIGNEPHDLTCQVIDVGVV